MVRNKLLAGPSPVGGSFGGLQSQTVYTLDEFELQAAYYNMACIYSKLGDTTNAVDNLRNAFQNGFDNYATVRGDPDLKPVQDTPEFDELMNEFDPKKLFGLF